MVTFTISLIVLIVGYLIYGSYVNRVFGPDNRKTPALTKADGVDYIPLPTWKIFMIQFLNIAGLGPIFGAIMGAQFGTASYIWIVFGTIFAGAVHDFFSGALSIRNGSFIHFEQEAFPFFSKTTRCSRLASHCKTLPRPQDHSCSLVFLQIPRPIPKAFPARSDAFIFFCSEVSSG